LDKIFMGNVGWVYRKEVGPPCDDIFSFLIKWLLSMLFVVGCISTTSTNCHFPASQVRRRPVLCQCI
jgi:hypothetical protein